jgi:tetratricopeptide (TPR) repeat protein
VGRAHHVAELALGDIVDQKYRIVRQLGSGGMGVVYAAHRLTLGDTVAIKCILPDRNSELNRARFLREARAAARIRHPNVVQIFDFGELDAAGTPYMVMEYLEGPTLSDLLAHPPRPTLERALAVFVQVCAAVQAGHRRGVVHRDIKPGNVILDQADDGRESIKVLDFGLAQMIEQPAHDLSAPEILIGTADYMAPEQVAGRPVSPASDVFSLGALLYELVTGQLPFRGDSMVNTLYRVSEAIYPSPTEHVRDLPRGVVEAIRAALSRDPKDRPRSPLAIAELAGAVVHYVDTMSSGKIASTPPPTTTDTRTTAAHVTVEIGRSRPAESVFIGRDEELAAIDHELTAAGHAPGRFILVTGEPGVGTSRLLEEAAARVAAVGAKVVRGRFFAYEGDRPPSHEAFAWMLEGVDPIGMRPAGRAAVGEHDRWQLFEDTARRLLERAGTSALVVAVEDLQWASGFDLDFLAYLPHAMRGHSTIVIATARPDLPPELSAFVAKLTASRSLRRLTLAPFDVAQTQAWLQATFGRLRIRPADVRRIHHVTSGNPFALSEVVRQLVDIGRMRREGEGWACDDLFDVGLPDTVQALVQARLADLDPTVREALEVACVVGEEFRFETVLAASGLAEDDLERRLELAVHGRLLTERGLSPGSDYRFASEALRTVLYDQLGVRRRRRVHRKVVDALLELYASDGPRLAGVFAHHFDAIGAWPEALANALVAAQRSFALYDTDAAQAALRHAERAASELASVGTPPTDEQRARFEYLVGAIDTRLGRVDQAARRLEHAVELAETADLGALAVDGLLELVDCQLGQGRFEAGVAAAQRAIERARSLSDASREAMARIKLSTCAAPLGRFDDAHDAIAPVLASTRPEDAGVRALAYRELCWIEVKRGHFAAAESAARNAINEAKLGGDAMARYRAESALGLVHAECGDYRAAVQRLRGALELARALSLRRREGIELGNIGESLYLLGEAEAGLEHAQQGLAIFVEIGDRACEADCRVNVGRMLRKLGRREEARAMLDLGRAACAASGRLEYEAIALIDLAELRLEDGDPMLARVQFEHARERLESIGAFQLWRAMFGLARSTLAIGQLERARELATEAGRLLDAQIEGMPTAIDATELTKARAEIERFMQRKAVATQAEPDVAAVGRTRLDEQHRELVAMSGEIFKHLPLDAPEKIEQLRALLARFGELLRLHAKAENRGLYPRLLQHRDLDIRTRAEGLYAAGMGLYDEYYAFADRWSTIDAITADPTRFAESLVTVFRRLGQRMRREEAELHPLADE